MDDYEISLKTISEVLGRMVAANPSIAEILDEVEGNLKVAVISERLQAAVEYGLIESFSVELVSVPEGADNTDGETTIHLTDQHGNRRRLSPEELPFDPRSAS